MTPRWQRAYLAVCAGVVAYELAYLLVDYARLPRLFHFQLEHELRLVRTGGGPVPAGYVGLWVWALGAGALAGAAGWLVGGRLRRPLSARALRLGAAWTLSSAVLAAAYFTWHNWP